MNGDEQELATRFYDGIQQMCDESERTLQSKRFQIGISDLGFCSERVRRSLDHQVPEDTDMTLAWLGHAIGGYAEEAALLAFPAAVRQAEVHVTLKGDRGEYVLPGHPDLILPEEGVLVDVKTDYGLTTIARTGPSQQQQFQRHCYAKGAWEKGYFGDLPLEDVQVANVWIDRAGIDKHPHVQMEPYDEGVVTQAGFWLEDVIYAYVNREEARKEPPRQMCEVVCGFYSVCREPDTDVSGLITDPDILASVEMYREGMELEKSGKRLKDESKQHLLGISGSTGEYLVRTTHVNPTVIPETQRAGYDKIEVRALSKTQRRVRGK